ncbi:MAG: DUF6063 family protein [Clostridium septicum]|uniref:DUF6063 family protein n=1 Tax=Clostridium septicum TaxID=1504 RepID=UPI00258792CB|nr:DUF6063 family protein [Clostridium septicum]MDU1314241.1 DUF6063 family protein [Clostridium septicum]
MDTNNKTALDIFSKVIRKIKIDDNTNHELYIAVVTNSFVRSYLEEMLEEMGLDLYVNERNGVFIAPKPNNDIFGYKNEGLRSELLLKNNSELYLTYFIIFTLISTFYIQSNYKTQVEYVTTKSLLDKVNEKLKPLSDSCIISGDYEASFKKLYAIWESFPESLRKDNETVSYDDVRGRTQIGLINRTMNFLIKQSLVMKDSPTGRYYITGRFEYMIERFFDDSNTDTVLMDLLDKEIERERLR